MKAAKKNFEKSNEIIGYNPDDNKTAVTTEEKIDNTPAIEEQPPKHEELKHPHQAESLWKIMIQVFSSKKTRQEYFNFLKSFFKRAA
jgi:hypothetical protein